MSDIKDDREKKQTAASKSFIDGLKNTGMLQYEKLRTTIEGGLGHLETYLPEVVQESFIGPRIWADERLEVEFPSPAETEQVVMPETTRWIGDRIKSREAGKDQIRKEGQAKRNAFAALEQPGKTRINDITVSIPPEQIHIQTSVKNVSIGTLRSHATQKVRTGHGYVQISLPLVFTSLDQVNQQLVPLAYQFRKSPFCRVENAYLRKVLMPHVDDEDRALMFTLQSINIHTVENLPTTIRCNLQLLWFNYLPYIRDIKYRKDFSLGQIANNTLTSQYEGPNSRDHMPVYESIPDTIKHSYSESNRHEQVRLMQSTGATREEKVRLYDQIQFPVDDPGDSWAWRKFAAGYNENLLFSGAEIDETSGSTSTFNSPGTKKKTHSREFGPDITMETAFTMSYEQFRKGTPPAEEKNEWREEIRGPEIWSRVLTFFANEDFNPIHVNVSYTNRVAQLPLLDQRLPTHQFVGSMDRELVVTFFVTEAGQATLKTFNEYIEDFEKQVFKFRSFTKDRWLEVSNPIAKLAGISKVVPERTDIQTVQGNPGASIVRVFFSEYSPFAFREPRKVGGGINGILRAFCQGIFDRLGGGDASQVVQAVDKKTMIIRNIERRLKASSPQLFLNPALQSITDSIAKSSELSDEAIANQARQIYTERWTEQDPVLADGLNAIHGIEEAPVYTPEQWLELIGAPSRTGGWSIYGPRFGVLFANQGENSLLWQAAADIVMTTQNHKTGFAWATDADVFGLKTLISMSLVYQGKNVNTKKLRRDAGELQRDLYDTLFSWLTKDEGLRAEFPNLFAELSNQYLDLNSCYPDLGLPEHPATGEFVDLEPDFYIYNPSLLAGADEDASADFDRAMSDAAQLIRQDVATAPDLDRNKAIDFTSATYGNTGKGQAVNVSSMPRGTRDSKLYKSLMDDEMIPIDQWLTNPVNPDTIAESAKDRIKKRNQLGMRKAFPTFRLYFVKEGRDQITYEGFQEMWGGFAIKEIRFVSSRKIPADLCVITMANLDGFMETDRLDDLREDTLQYEQDQNALRGSQEEMVQYQKNYERMNHWIAYYNFQRNTNVDPAWVAKLMDWEKRKPTPNAGGPFGTTPEHARIAEGKELSVSDLRQTETSIKIACDVITLYGIDLAGYTSSFYYNEIAITQYRFPQHASDIFQAVASQIDDNSVLDENWYKRVQNTEVKQFVQFLRPSETVQAQSKRAALDRDIARQTLSIREQEDRINALDNTKGNIETEARTGGATFRGGYPSSDIDPELGLSSQDVRQAKKARQSGVGDKTLTATEISEGSTREATAAGLASLSWATTTTQIQGEKIILKKMKKELESLKITRDRYVTHKLATQGILFSEGTNIVLKMGYSNDPEKLETVFAGQVTEAQPAPGEVVVVAQNFATEFVQEVKGLDEDMTQKGEESLYKLAEWILTMPEVKHFGRWQWRTESWEDEAEMRGNDDDPADERASVDGGIIRTLLSPFFEGRVANYLSRRFEFNNNPSDDNIYLIEEGRANSLRRTGHRFLAAAADFLSPSDAIAGEFSPNLEDFTLNKRTLWQGLIDMQHNFPGYVMGVRPYSEGTRKGTWWRNTLFFGLPDMTYLTKTPDAISWELYRQRTTELKRILKAQTAFTLPEDIDPWASPYSSEQTLEALYKEFSETSNARREPFRRYHTITSYSDIIDNGIITTKRGNYNGVTLRGRELEGRHTSDDIARKKLAGMDESNIRWLYVDSDNARGDRGEPFAKSLLLEVLRDIYTGDITILGNPEIRPYDIVYLHDSYNEMFGPVEVEQVVHTFSESTGFITQIVPDLVVSAADQMKTSILGPIGVYGYRHLLSLAGVDWRQADSQRTLWENFRKGLIGVGSTVAIMGLMVAFPFHFLPVLLGGSFFLNNFITEEERIRIQPVFHKGKPFVTGIEGFQNPDTLNPMMNALNLMLKSATGKYEATTQFLSNAFNPYSVEAYLEHGYYQLYHAP